jgi:hypothetical protein
MKIPKAARMSLRSSVTINELIPRSLRGRVVVQLVRQSIGDIVQQTPQFTSLAQYICCQLPNLHVKTPIDTVTPFQSGKRGVISGGLLIGGFIVSGDLILRMI